jgi:hypothetical protein
MVGAESGAMGSIEMLQLALLGIALFLVAARLRVLAGRRRGGHAPPRAPARRAVTPPARRATPVVSRRSGRDEWPFPDPSAPAPTFLLPSTASARRRARELAVPGDRG